MNQHRKPSTRDEIVNACAQLICTNGVAGTTIAQIIQESGTSAGAIYHHFGSKNEIITEVTRHTIEWPIQALAAYKDEPRSPAELLSFALQAIQSAPEIGDLLVQLGAGAASDDDLGHLLRQEFIKLRDSLGETITIWANKNAKSAPDLNSLTQILVGLVLGFVSQRRLILDFDEDAYLQYAQQLMIDAVRD